MFYLVGDNFVNHITLEGVVWVFTAHRNLKPEENREEKYSSVVHADLIKDSLCIHQWTPFRNNLYNDTLYSDVTWKLAVGVVVFHFEVYEKNTEFVISIWTMRQKHADKTWTQWPWFNLFLRNWTQLMRLKLI